MDIATATATAAMNTTKDHAVVPTKTAVAAILAELSSSISVNPIPTVFLGMIILAFYLLLRPKIKKDQCKKISPPVAPFGILECIRNMTSDQNPWFVLKIKKTMGNNIDTFMLPLPRRPIITGDYLLAREILTDPLTTKPRSYREFEPLGIGTIFTRNGPFWHARRRGSAPAFSNRHIRRMNQVALETTEKWIRNVVLPCAREGRSFDVGKEMISITFEAICKTAFEYEISDSEKEKFVENLNLVCKEFLAKSTINPLRKYMGRIIPGRRRALQAARDNHTFAKKIIAQYKAKPNPVKGTIIYHIVNNPCYASIDEMAADLLIFLIAGHDTTAYTIAFTLLLLAKHPHEQKKIRDEILAESREKDSDSALLSPATWGRSGALQMAIKESTRLFPVSASGSVRVCGREFVTKEGWTIPRGSVTIAHFTTVHRNRTVFGSDAEEYRPDRWIDPTQAQKDSLMIFSAGRQNCLGQSLAQAEMQCMVRRILSSVELEIEDPGTISFFLTLKPIGCRLRPVLSPITASAHEAAAMEMKEAGASNP